MNFINFGHASTVDTNVDLLGPSIKEGPLCPWAIASFQRWVVCKITRFKLGMGVLAPWSVVVREVRVYEEGRGGSTSFQSKFYKIVLWYDVQG